jgi:hypothetical protein
MKLDEKRLIDDALVSDEPCLGAVFCSYTFDPAYFEEHVLRAVLRLNGDPEEDAVRYHEEARRALQETPVACIVDATVRKPGRRLPYDLHLVRRRTFHPKVYLLVFDTEARLAVGSGNLTKAGLEQNTELFFHRRLRYDQPMDALLLRSVDSFLAACQKLSGVEGTQLTLVRDTLANRLERSPAPKANARPDVAFVSTLEGRLLDRLNDVIHPGAKLTRVGVLAPFFERDDLQVGSADVGMRAMLPELLSLRPAANLELDIAAPWEDAPVAAPTTTQEPSLDDPPGGLWAWRHRTETDNGAVEHMEYFTLDAVHARRVDVTDAGGVASRRSREDCEQAIAERRLWPTARPVVHAPKAILEHLAREHHVQLWLHPSTGIEPSGRVRRRPLHAKVILVTSVYRGKTVTHALIGSANGSHAALARGVEQGGNVEACMLCEFDEEVTLRALLPTLVHASLDGSDIQERDIIEAGVDLSAWIEDVVHDAAQKTLVVHWHQQGPAPLGAWELRELDRLLASGNGPAAETTLIAPFELSTRTAEVTFLSGEGEWTLPIRVLDLAQLPTDALAGQLGLRELLALLGRRVSSERLATLHAQRGGQGVDAVLDAVFGEGFGPTDVFKAWWGAVEDLRLAGTVAAFRHRLTGPTGLAAAWTCLREAPESVLSADEAWVYGCELLRELLSLDIPTGPDTPSKQQLLASFTDALRTELHDRVPGAHGHTWLEPVMSFYGVGGTHEQA